MKKVNCVHDGIVCTALGEAFCFWTLILLIPICPRIGSPSQHPFSENVILCTSILLSWVIFKIYIVLHCTVYALYTVRVPALRGVQQPLSTVHHTLAHPPDCLGYSHPVVASEECFTEESVMAMARWRERKLRDGSPVTGVDIAASGSNTDLRMKCKEGTLSCMEYTSSMGILCQWLKSQAIWIVRVLFLVPTKNTTTTDFLKYDIQSRN